MTYAQTTTIYLTPLSSVDSVNCQPHAFLMPFSSMAWDTGLHSWGKLRVWVRLCVGIFTLYFFIGEVLWKSFVFRRRGFITLSPTVMKMYTAIHIFPQKWSQATGGTELWHRLRPNVGIGPQHLKHWQRRLVGLINADYRQLICGNQQLKLALYLPPYSQQTTQSPQLSVGAPVAPRWPSQSSRKWISL